MSRRSTTSPAVAEGVARGVDMPISTGVVRLTDEPGGSTTVWVRGVPSSSMRVEKDVLDFEYMRHIAAVIEAWQRPARMLALHVGAGVCTMARYLVHAYPDSRHIAVDIDTALPELARQWWDLPRSPQLRVRAQDGLDAVASRHDDSLDVLVRDAFSEALTPPTLADAVWWSHARRTVRAGGVVVANVGTVPGSAAHVADAAAARAAFGDVVAIGEPAVLKGKRRGNVVLAAGAGLNVDELRRYAASAPLPTVVDAAWAR
ncbi:spermidine synthase [Demequina sp. NBRC 110055]|uniref:spermidine synthase n=1 Tax=Demequina sp. NBRC 110055 TaxID=1570344 RepID=UPI0011855170|nr:fused MFS/spermidine synthase [Demequina sp. NBRC 110055]